MASVKKYIAELIGTCVLVTLGCGTAMLVGCDAASGSGYLLTALAFGLVIVGMAYCIGNISGCPSACQEGAFEITNAKLTFLQNTAFFLR